MDLEIRSLWEGALELRQDGRSISGAFPYNSVATIANVGRTRKERFSPGAFRYSIEREDFDVSLLSGHSFDKPIASKLAGSLRFDDGQDALRFTAELPIESEQPSWIRDTVLSIRSGLARGISPGFKVPPASAVSRAEELIPEPGNPSVMIRQLNDVLLPELSIVVRPAYADTSIAVRHELELQEKPEIDHWWWMWL